MFKNYFLIAWRNLAKNKLSSFINITGLAIGLSIFILVFLWINNSLAFNRFHTHYADIHQLMKTQRGAGGDVSTGSSVPGQLAEAAKAAIAEIKYTARGQFDGPLFQYKDKTLYQTSLYTDPDFFEIMTFPAIQGDPITTLRDPGSMVITETAAKRLFGSENPMGKTVTINSLRQLKVGAVIRDVPEHSSLHFDIVLPFSLFEKDNEWLKKWDDNRIFSWVQLQPNSNRAAVDAKLTKLLREKTNDSRLEIFAYPLEDTWLRNSFKNGHPDGGRITALKLMGTVGIFVLIIACINFMNLATARSEHRSREVGVRKTLGASRRQLILQFLSEAFLQTFFALALSILLTKLFLPVFNRFTQGKLTLDLSGGYIWTALLSVGLLTALVAGSYPAFFLSRFQPVRVLKGLFTPEKGGSLFRKGLVTFQFVITIFLILSTIVILRQEKYVEDRPIGYDQENLVDIAAQGDMKNKYPLIKNELMKIPGVASLSAGSDDIVRFGSGNDGIQWPGKTASQDFYVKVTDVQYDWVKTAGLKMAEGRDFSPDFGTDTSACLINQAAVSKMGLKEPVIGTRLGTNTIVGVVADFVFNDAFNTPEPMVIYLTNGAINHIFVRIRNNDQWQQTMAAIGAAVKKTAPGYPFDFHFTSETWQRQFNGIKSTATTLNWIGGLAILISCLGLFGMSAFLAERRTKEIGIRKILGAGVSRIWFNLSSDFMRPVFLAFLIAGPLAGWALNAFLSKFDYRIVLSWWIFALTGFLAFAIAFATVSFQAIRAARANPVKSLRSE